VQRRNIFIQLYAPRLEASSHAHGVVVSRVGPHGKAAEQIRKGAQTAGAYARTARYHPNILLRRRSMGEKIGPHVERGLKFISVMLRGQGVKIDWRWMRP
jgi:hypothetical protein